MASALYNHALESFISQNPSIDMDTDTIKVAAVDLTADYTFSASHQFKSSVTSYSGSTDATVTSASVTSGTFDGNDNTPAWASLAQSAAKTVGALVLYKSTGVAGTSPLIAYFDLGTAITPNGGDINITWNASGLFSI